MNLIDKAKAHWLICIIIIGVACFSSTWFAANELLVKPRDFALNEREKKITEKEKEISSLNEKIKKVKRVPGETCKEKEVQLEKIKSENNYLKNRVSEVEKKTKDVLIQLEDCNSLNANFQIGYLNSESALSMEPDGNIKGKELNKVKVDDIFFILNKCSLSGNLIQCNLSILNNRKNDTELAITHGTLFDQDGVRYNAIVVSIGGHETGWMTKQELISGVKTAADIAFDVSKGHIKKITALKFYTYGAFGENVSNWGNKGSGARLVAFKDITINK